MPCSQRCGSCRPRGADIEECAAACPLAPAPAASEFDPAASHYAEDLPEADTPELTPHYQVAIIGGGVIGLAVARNLSKFTASVLVIERTQDVAQGATKANSGIVHGGFDDKPGSVKASVCFRGNQMFTQLDKELQMGFRRTGSLVLGFNDEDRKGLEELLQRGITNGLTSCRIIERDEIRKLEPNVNRDVTAALWCPDAGLVSPYEYAIALAQNAVTNGVVIRLGEEVTSIDVLDATRPAPVDDHPDEEELRRTVDRVLKGMEDAAGDSVPHEKKKAAPDGAPRNFLVHTNGGIEGGGFQYTASIVINCAGLFSDRIADMVGAGDFTITPRKGEYLVLDRPKNPVVNTVLFPMPSKERGKGILVSPTHWGQILLGPTSRKIEERMGREEVVRAILSGAHHSIDPPKLIPHLRKVLTSYTGLRAKSSRGDFIIEESRVPNFINVAGIDSPGLTASYAIAEKVEGIIRACRTRMVGPSGEPAEVPTVELLPDPTYDPRRPRLFRRKPPTFDGVPDDPRGPDYNVICRCEVVTETEVLRTIRGPVGARGVDGIKWRCRAGMGLCQGSYCQPRVTKILARDLEIPEEMVPQRGAGSSLLPHRRALWEDRKQLVDMWEEAGEEEHVEPGGAPKL
ncbi:FAD dependent oxidoreductase [Hyaloraphidium curvatum]|nr:FAD dependent oxidoreductase [Hyaloraphidium curvatum]